MRITFFFLLFLLSTAVLSQEDFLAKQYFNDGAFEKAVVFYEKLVVKNPRRTDYGEGLIACYQQLERYEDAEKYLLEQLENPRAYPTFYVELGYNHTLQNEDDKAREYYEKALARIEENPNYGYGIGFRFQKYALLDWALSAYSKAMELNPELDYNYQMAKIYGEQGDVEKMYRSYLTLISEGKTSKSNVLRSIDDFISSDPENGNNLTLKKVLLENAQRNPDILWNELLSWLFVQQKQFRSAFRQEKAIYKRMDGSSMQRLEGLGELTLEENDYEIAQEIFEYIVENTADKNTRLNAQLNLIDLKLLDANAKTINAVQQQYEALMEVYGYDSQTLQLQVAWKRYVSIPERGRKR